MVDVALETVRALILFGIVLFLWRLGRRRFEAARAGWNLIVAGFGLLLFGSLIDITDNFEALNRFVVVGDTEMQAFLEKFVGFLGGFLVLAWGLVLWMPQTQRLSFEIDQRRRAEETLRHEREMLEIRVRERTGELEAANADLHGEIAERKRAVAEIGKREARLRETGNILTATIRNFPGGISVFDADLRLVAFNQAFSEVLEFPPHLVRDGMRYEDIIRFNAERGEYGEGDIEQLVQTRVDQARRFEPHCFERNRPTGEIIEIRGAPMPEGGFITTYTDITERKRAEEALRTSEQRYRELFDESPAAIWTEDWSAIKQMLDDLARSGVEDWRGYFNSHRDQLRTVYDLVKVTEITLATIDLYRMESKEELIRTSAAEVVIDEELDAFLEIVLAFLAGRVTVDIEAKDTAGDGSEIIVRRRVVMPAKYHDDWSRVMYACEDVTERKRAVAEIEKRDAFLRGIVTTVADGVITTDERGIITSFNPGAERIFGHDAGEVIGRNIKLLMPDEFARDHDGHVARYRGAGASSAVGVRRNLLGLHKDGATFPMDLVLNEMRIDGRRMFTGIIRDITEQREREAALRSKTAKLALMEAVASSANEIADTDAFIQSCIDDICRYSGWPVGHAYRIGSDGESVLHPTNIWHLDDPARFETFRRITEQTSFGPGVGLIGRVMASGEPAWVVDVTKYGDFVRAAGGAEIGVKGAFTVPVMVRNECVMVLEFFSPDAKEPDRELLAVIANVAEQISRRMEREAAEQALRAAKAQAERAERRALSAAAEARAASQAKSDFLANMSHELRTPLNGILGLAALIEQETLGPLGHEQYAGYIKIIGSSGRHLVTVINDVLDYSKIEAGMLTLDPVPFDPSEMAANAVELLIASAHEKAIELTCSVAPEVPVNLIGDPERLRQILLNLTGNAIKFTDQGSVKVGVSLEAVNGADVVLRFEVCDTGIGIAKQAQATLFDKFTQADVSTTRKFGGTGLGLAISKQLVGLMDGEIGVDSEPGQGSTFWFTVKLARQADEARGDRGISGAAAPVSRPQAPPSSLN